MRPRRIHSSRNGHTHISLHVLAEILEPNWFFRGSCSTRIHSCNVMCIHTRLMSPDFKEFGALWKKVFGSSIAPSLAAGDVTLGWLGERIAISDLYVSVSSVHNCILFDKWSECDFKRTAEKHRPWIGTFHKQERIDSVAALWLPYATLHIKIIKRCRLHLTNLFTLILPPPKWRTWSSSDLFWLLSGILY